jgi:hypothetical protein
MDPDGGAGGVETVHPLGQQPADHPGQHIAAARGGQPGRAIVVDEPTPVRGGDHRLWPLQHHHRPGPCRRLGRGLFPPVDQQVGKQAAELALMRGQDIIAVQQGEQVRGPALEHRQTVGIDHQGRPGPGQGVDIGDGGVVDPGGRPDHHGVHPVGQFRQDLGIGERFQHHRLDRRGQHRHSLDRTQQADDTGPDPEAAAGGQTRCAGLTGTTTDDPQPAAGVFVRIRPRPWQSGAPVRGILDGTHRLPLFTDDDNFEKRLALLCNAMSLWCPSDGAFSKPVPGSP